MVTNYYGENYKAYFTTPHWQQLKDQLIYSNPLAKCWICDRTNTLLIHHESYENLFREKLGSDIFILCYKCHEQLHISKWFFLFTIKHRLDTRNLRKRRLYLKILFCIRNMQFIKLPWYIIIYHI